MKRTVPVIFPLKTERPVLTSSQTNKMQLAVPSRAFVTVPSPHSPLNMFWPCVPIASTAPLLTVIRPKYRLDDQT